MFTGSASSPGTILANVILFQNPWPFAPFEAGMTVTTSTSSAGTTGSVVLLNPGIELCGGTCLADSFRTSRQRLIAHELGHFIGLGHSGDSSDLMYASLTAGGSLDDVKIDRAALGQVIR